MSAEGFPILFTSAGRRVELIRCFRAAAGKLGLELEVHACDLQPDLSAACRDADARFAVPRCTDDGYVERLIEYCEAKGIRLLVPTIDPELHPLALAKDRFAAIGTMVHVSSPETIEIVRDKALTAARLAQAGVPVPKTATADEVRADPASWRWPSFIKPSGGSASRGIGEIASPEELLPHYDEPMILQDLLDGEEYTVNIYIDAHGRLASVIPHVRLSVRAGEVEKGRTTRCPDIGKIAESIVEALPGLRGVSCFQLIDDARFGMRVFEINARFGGGYPLADHAGGRFAESVLALANGRSECASNVWQDGATMLRYDGAVFV
ncbi:ATP-grasp domain-containing protein [Qipengyuania gelatinilytica]|uniref:ATP-grasp domain-containing protein n=1 Tax=Qipengyuania gelatinilytica TaxID=2867231 RepID=A0ABX9A380_9SPHN|nr:ATP-grasp domain-containing protein [Qipengyuania gelatinilytica]QZD95736.1 ATP-grasp domain-containing protein [Qipengyuania gelatinilytica]